LIAHLARGVLDLAHRRGEGSSDRGRRMLALEGVAMSVDDHVFMPGMAIRS
jgi:hypothetical protein